MQNSRRVEDLLFRRKQIENKMRLILTDIVPIEEVGVPGPNNKWRVMAGITVSLKNFY